ncbi:hypothetical protein BJX68DRAFT_128072 [Aspergillus pseudodeflectus]|uniref:Uncharacterized protein n=1 Tax=Aspergillus pseudodeflectus TaxID=176178 RepID=A0ABR4K1Y0_9EURO
MYDYRRTPILRTKANTCPDSNVHARHLLTPRLDQPSQTSPAYAPTRSRKPPLPKPIQKPPFRHIPPIIIQNISPRPDHPINNGNPLIPLMTLPGPKRRTRSHKQTPLPTLVQRNRKRPQGHTYHCPDDPAPGGRVDGRWHEAGEDVQEAYTWMMCCEVRQGERRHGCCVEGGCRERVGLQRSRLSAEIGVSLPAARMLTTRGVRESLRAGRRFVMKGMRA